MGKRHGHGKSYRSNGEVYIGEWRDDAPLNIYLSSEALNENVQQMSLNPQPGPRQSLQEKFFAYVEQGDVGQASQLFTNNKTYLDKNASNANGLTAIEVAVKKYQWDMFEWLLDNGFKCEGVEKIVGKKYDYGYVYVGEVMNGCPHGHGRCTYSYGAVYEGEWKDGYCHGHGKLTYTNGDVYEGEYKDSYRHGHGKVTYKDGRVKEGRWFYDGFKG